MKVTVSHIALLLCSPWLIFVSAANSQQQPLGSEWPALGGPQSSPTVPPNGWAALSYSGNQQQQGWPALPGQQAAPSSTARPPAATPSSPPSWASLAGQGGQVPQRTNPPRNPPPSRTTPRSRPAGQRTQTTPSSSVSKATDAELATFSENAFKKDTTNNHYQHVTVNLQGRVSQNPNEDSAPNKLLKVNESALLRSPTIEKLRLLYNNYELDSSVNEYVTAIERKEESDFLDAVLATPVMRYTMQLLHQKGVVSADPADHKELLRTIWFNTYSRGQGKIGSSGFEHVFLTEIKNGSVTGLHNWIYFLEEEGLGNVDYKGYSKSFKLGNKGEIVKMRFCRKQLCKPTTSMLVGVSPELEMALYTACFELRPDAECPLEYAGKTFTIKTHTYKYRGKQLVGSAFIQA